MGRRSGGAGAAKAGALASAVAAGAEAAGAERQQDQDQPVEKATAVKRVCWRRVTPRKTIFCETLQLNRSLSCHWQRLTKGTANRSVSQKELHSVSQKEPQRLTIKELQRLTSGTEASHKWNCGVSPPGTASHKWNCGVSPPRTASLKWNAAFHNRANTTQSEMLQVSIKGVTELEV